MSNKEKVTEQQEKVMTKYDRKKQKREEAKQQAKKQKNRDLIVWVLILVALVCFIAYFPIRNAMAVKENFVKIKGEDISRVEFEYNYNVVKNNYLNTMGSYLAMFGLDLTADLSTQWYTEDLTWEDYFEQQTVDSIIRGKALKAEAEAAGFVYDVEADYKVYVENIKAAAAETGITVSQYLKQAYGSYATLDRVEEYIKESLYVNAYYTQLGEDMAPSDDEITAYYEADKVAFDSVDYYITVIEAALPTEPTELADPVDETAEATEGGEEEAYQPSEAEIEKAMADAKAVADTAAVTIATEGELREGAKYSGTSNIIRDWLFDDARVEGDVTVAEDTANNKYFVVSFVKRYLDETPSADVRIITAEADGGQAILDEWKNGEATEESFGVLADKYNEGSSFTAEGGLYVAVTQSGTLDVIADWLYAEGRVAGDTTCVTTEDGATSYVLYYVGENEPEWKMNASTEILAEDLENHLQEISAGYEVDDFNNNLEYIKILEAKEAESEATETEAE
uniref:SurA N-terminal domain-containing protein n=1 Tax=Acetatifactor sp. TaxID=1872090 RepID=UPI0040577419